MSENINNNENKSLEINDTITIRVNRDDKEAYNEKKDALGLSAGELFNIAVRDLKSYGLLEADFNVTESLSNLKTSLNAIESTFANVVNNAKTFVIKNKETTAVEVNLAREKMNNVINTYTDKEEKHKKEINELLLSKEDLSKQVKELNTELTSKDAAVLELDAKVKDLELDVTTLKEEKLNLLADVKDRNTTIENLREVEKQHVSLKKIFEQLEKENNKHKDDITKLDTSLKDLININRDLETTIDTLNQEVTEQKKSYTALNDKYIDLDREHNKTLDKVEDLNDKLAESKDIIKDLNAVVRAKDKELSDLEKAKYKEINQLTESLRSKDVEHKEQLGALELSYKNKLADEIAKIKVSLEKEHANELKELHARVYKLEVENEELKKK